jgi:hypothetical protein
MFSRLFCGLTLMVVYSGSWCAALQDNGDGTVIDQTTGRTWQQVDDDTKRNWEGAHIYCDGLSLGDKTDWRLPNPTELASIVVYQTGNPSINDALFPSTNSSGYWSASSMAGNSSKAWYVDFYHGPVDFNSKTKSHYARCIR